MHIPQRVMVALQNRVSCLLYIYIYKKTSIIGKGLTFGGLVTVPGLERIAGWSICLFSNLSFFSPLPLCHPQAWLAFARVILGMDGQGWVGNWIKAYETWRECQHILAKQKKVLSSQFIGKKNKLKICSPGEIKAFQRNIPWACSRTKNVSRISCCS